MDREYTVNRNIEKHLSEQSKKQAVIACAAGFSPAVFSKIVRCKRKVYADEVVPIADALGVPIESLFVEVSET